MITVLGSNACNEKEFSAWFKEGKAFGLLWNLTKLTVSMPPEKVAKALHRIREMKTSARTTRTKLNKILGSLRHVVTCIRPAVSFFQRVAELARLAPRLGSRFITKPVKEDLQWFDLILQMGRLNSIPMLRFAERSVSDFHVHMDATRKQYFQLEFDDAQLQLIQEFNQTGDNDVGINVRELMSVVYASLVWGSVWTRSGAGNESHIRFWIDNMAEVSWSNKRFSRNSFAQLLLRILSLCEVLHGSFATAAHIAGVNNDMADAGSRVGRPSTRALTFAHLSSSWEQVEIRSDWRNLSTLWEHYCAREL
ncbi:Cleavage induced protein [Phytophthora megakarya]|uniref:Cleavage induced protein n=1 Tax=Phytophthora megakarya TaxID=4795 RepID=A0A225WQH6_9STRA|nr:Cleavage induced protein [Phytophthora megakarya]